MNGSLEHTLAFHCAPALAGIKPSNLICCDPLCYPSLDQELLLEPAQPLNAYGLASGFCPARQKTAAILTGGKNF
ncbi:MULTISPECIES: hypothetical protein [Anaerotruncus]|uniref:hypothetical protein n=1 Tax=Anaerotruncus TaxID=244127 RepID=UPI0015D61E4E|nr:MULTISPECIES: hypothetical protein [Anaerotruncus]MCR2024921.1 DUF3793 family protein [Anaerotruncus colihominis]